MQLIRDTAGAAETLLQLQRSAERFTGSRAACPQPAGGHNTARGFAFRLCPEVKQINEGWRVVERFGSGPRAVEV